ncbi:MAG: LysR family transcriptional regulator [Proteobacteria bacterium]|nr:LysR family transcriptional regulator [Pseudomonadota bacterium]MCP4920128.1 LysR family transcriptional regulator [Pseudomonadota bacterium]
MARLVHTLDQLEVLDAIERSGSFAGAARELHRVPSAISYAVKTLEEQLDVALFERSGNRTHLTAAGRRLLEEARLVLEAGARLERTAQELRDGWEPDLHVVVDGVYPMEPIARALRQFAADGIPTRLRVDVEYQEGVPSRWASERADLMLILDFDPEDDPLVVHPLPPLEMVLVGAPDHQTVELVVKDSSPRFDKTPRAGFEGATQVVYLSDFHGKRLALVEGAGFGWVPEHLVAEDLAAGRVQLVDRPTNRWTYTPSLVSRAGAPLGRAGRRFLELIIQEA